MTSDHGSARALFEALERLEHEGGGSMSTSLRLPLPLHEALTAATSLGLGRSFNAAASAAIEEAVRAFAHRLAIDLHYEESPEDRPSRAEVAAVRVRGTDHPLADREDLLEQAETWLTEHGHVVSVDSVLAVADSWLDAAVA